VLIVVSLTIFAAVIRFWGIGHQSFWYDEGLTDALVRNSPGRMFGLLTRIESNPPIYYSLAWLWVRIFGFGEAGLRSLSAVAGVAVVPAMYGIGAKLISRRVGLVAAALATFNPLLIWYSQEARSYSLVVLLATLSWLAFVHVLAPKPSVGWLVAWWVASCLAVATHYYSLLAVGPQVGWLLWTHRRNQRTWLAVAGVAAVGAALVPLALAQQPTAGWIAGWPLDERLSQIVPLYVLGTGAPARTVLKLAGAVAILLAAYLLARRADPAERRGGLLAGGLALAGFLLSLLLILVGVDELITRNVIVLLVPLIVMVAAGLGARRAGVRGLAGAAVLCTIGLTAAIAVATDSQFQRPDWRGLAHLLAANRLPDGAVAIVVQDNDALHPLVNYMPGLRFIRRSGDVVGEVALVAAGGGPAGAWFCWWGSACNLRPSTLATNVRLSGFARDGRVRHVGQFSVLLLRPVSPVRLTPHAVARALRHAQLKYGYALLVQPSG
jgi:hypothetical protein